MEQTLQQHTDEQDAAVRTGAATDFERCHYRNVFQRPVEWQEALADALSAFIAPEGKE